MPQNRSRRVVINDKPKGKGKYRQKDKDYFREDLGIVKPSYLPLRLSPPTGDRRHTSKIRDGAISFEVFAKNRLRKILVDPDVQAEEVVDNASQKSQTAEVGVRGEGSSVGSKTPLQPTDKTRGKAKAQKRSQKTVDAKARKRSKP